MNSSPDHNLLFAFIAFQLDFVKREQLVAAVSIWLLDKSRRIDDIFLEQQALTREECNLLNPLIDKHLANHGGDARQSLATLSSLDSVANDLRSLGDDQVEATLSLVAPNAGTDGLDVTTPHPAYPAPREQAPRDLAGDARFQVLRSHAKGGLGEVYLAKDTQLNRDVALKEIQGRFADDESSRMRFLLEAEITGGLEHPGIVPVYGLGRYDDGRPFYAMRFIKGNSLQEAANRFHGKSPAQLDSGSHASETDVRNSESSIPSNPRDFASLEFRKLLGRFIDVCQAIEYAHSRGVLHRDLKPGNIMLGKYGETLVVDWGLAKVRGCELPTSQADESLLQPASASGTAPTMLGSAIGTPAFMPPEQAAGNLEQLGPASDVYSLGATLYYLLTGQAPFRGRDLAKILNEVKAGRYRPPRAILPEVPKPLAAICRKAMAKDPSGRYESPQQLADDVERYLADEPVSAFQEPLAVRIRRTIRKRPALSAATATVVIVSAIGLGVFTSVLSRKNTELQGLNTSLRQANARETQARQQAETNAETARAQSALALATLGTVIGDIQSGIATLPGSGALRRRLLSTSLEKLRDISTAHLAQAQVNFQSMKALGEMGDLVLVLGTDDATAISDATGSQGLSVEQVSAVELADRYFRRALEIGKSLLAESDEPQIVVELAYLSANLARVQHRLGFRQEAQTLCVSGLRSLDELPAKTQTLPGAQQAKTSLKLMLGDVQLALGDTEAARKSYTAALTTTEGLAESDPANSRFRLGRVRALERLADIYFQSGDSQASLANVELALETCAQLNADDPDNLEYQRNTLLCYLKLGDIRWFRQELDQALTAYQSVQTLASNSLEQNPNRIELRDALSIAYEKIALIKAYQGQPNQDWIRLGLETREALVQLDPSNMLWQTALSALYDLQGEAKMRAGEFEDALRTFEKSLAIREALVNEEASAEAKRALALSYAKLGGLKHESKAFDESLEDYHKALELFQEMAAADPTNGLAMGSTQAVHTKLAGVHESRGAWQEAAAEYEQAAAIFAKMLEANQLFLPKPQAQSHLDSLRDQAEDARNNALALGEWEPILQQPRELQIDLLEFRAVTFSERQRFPEAAQAAIKLLEHDEVKAKQFYNAAIVLGRCITSVETSLEKEPRDTWQQQREELLNHALKAVKRAMEGDLQPELLKELQEFEGLSSLRELPEYQALMKDQ